MCMNKHPWFKIKYTLRNYGLEVNAFNFNSTWAQSSWSIKVYIAAQKFETCIMDRKGSDQLRAQDGA